jgi:hypothetical protein
LASARILDQSIQEMANLESENGGGGGGGGGDDDDAYEVIMNLILFALNYLVRRA